MIDPSGLFGLAEVMVAIAIGAATLGFLLPSIRNVYVSARESLALSGYINLVRSLTNQGTIPFEMGRSMIAEAQLAFTEVFASFLNSAAHLALEVFKQYAYGMLFSGVTHLALGGLAAGVKLGTRASVKLIFGEGETIIRHHLVFKSAVRRFVRQRLWYLPERLHAGAPEGLHFRIAQSREFSILQPRGQQKMTDLLEHFPGGRQAWLDKLGEAYKWLETKWPGDYKGIYEGYLEAVKQIGGVAGLK